MLPQVNLSYFGLQIQFYASANIDSFSFTWFIWQLGSNFDLLINVHISDIYEACDIFVSPVVWP